MGEMYLSHIIPHYPTNNPQITHNFCTISTLCKESGAEIVLQDIIYIVIT